MADQGDDSRVAKWEVHGAEVSSEDEWWLALQREAPKASLESCYRAATALASMLAVLVPAHLALLGLKMNGQVTLVALAPEGTWALAMYFVLTVLLPKKWTAGENRPESIRDGFNSVLAAKVRAIWVGAALTFLGVLAAALVWR